MPTEPSSERVPGPEAPIPITVVGGYLGSGKTTLLNAVLRRADGARIGVIVNDFGELGIDAALLGDAASDGDVVNLANGCVCCTLGDDLRAALVAMADTTPRLDHIVVEASGVADPAATAAWGTVAPFAPGGVIVLVAADTIATLGRDRYVGGEVRRQIAGADLVIVTKTDRCSGPEAARAESIIAELGPAPRIVADSGDVPLSLVLGPTPAGRPDERPTEGAGPEHDVATYVRWSFTADSIVDIDDVRRFVDALPAGLLRLKGTIERAADDRFGLVQVVGRTGSVVERAGRAVGIRLEAVGVAGAVDLVELDRLAVEYLRPA